MGDYGAGWGSAYLQKEQMRNAPGEAKDMIDYQMSKLQEMFPFTGLISDYAMDLYSSGNLGKITDFLEHPTPPSVQLQNLSDFFGGFQPQKGYSRTGGGKKSGPGALQNRLYGRFGAGGSGEFFGLGQEMLDKEVGLLESLIPYGQDLASTGFRTDIGPAQDYAMNLFEREMMPTVAERFGSNISGSGFNNEMGRTMSDLGYELGALQVGLDESAANRRLQGLQSGTVQGLFAAPMDRTIDFLGAGAQAGEQYKNAMNQARPGYSLLNAMPGFASMGQGQNFIQPGYPTSGTDMGGLLSALGQTGSGLNSLPWNKWFGGDNSGLSTWNSWDGMNTGSDGSLVGSWTDYGGGGGGGGDMFGGGGGGSGPVDVTQWSSNLA